MIKQNITEEMGVHESWYKHAKSMTLEKLPEFLRHLSEDFVHDYGTTVHALAASAVAAAHAFNHGPAGGITGFQAGCVFWSFYQHWMGQEGPARIIHFDDMLFPQYGREFQKTISRETWDYLQNAAKARLAGSSGKEAPLVIAHWKSITEGVVPFGYVVKEEA